MSINWYPGHMHKASKEMVEVLPQVDLIIEILDARIPYSSENPNIAKIRGDKPCIKILNKCDLADPIMTEKWRQHLEQDKAIRTLALSHNESNKNQLIIELCHKMAPHKSDKAKDVVAMIMGIPNVGKSTLINSLAGRVVAKTGNEPAVTKGQQRIKLDDGIMLLDTPGILWPKFDNADSAYRLATTGAIKDTAISHDDIAFFAVEWLLKHYPRLLSERFKIEQLPATELEFLELLGAQRGCLRAGGRVDLEKVSSIFLNEFRSGNIGRITLETPAMAYREKLAVIAKLATEAEARESNKTNRKKKFKKKK